MKRHIAASLFAASLLLVGASCSKNSDGPKLDNVDLAQELAIVEFNDQLMAYANFKAMEGMSPANFTLPAGASITANGVPMTLRSTDDEWTYARALSASDDETVEFVYTRDAQHKYTNTVSIKSLLAIYPAYNWTEYEKGRTYYYSYVPGILADPNISPEEFFGGEGGREDPNKNKVQDLNAIEVVRAYSPAGMVYTATCNRINRTFSFPSSMPAGTYTIGFYAYYEKSDLKEKEGIADGKRMLQRLKSYENVQIKDAQ